MNNLTPETIDMINHFYDFQRNVGISQQRGRPVDWKSPFEWTDKEVHDLVIKEIGVDETFVTGYRLILKLWKADERKNGTYMPETLRNNDMTVAGMIIGMGGDAFRDLSKFPSGPTHTYGEWVIFRPYEDQKIKKNGHTLTFINDDRICGFDTDPSTLQSALKLEEEYKMRGH